MMLQINTMMHADGMVWYGMVWYGMVWYGMVDVCDGYLAAEASGSSVEVREGAPVAVSGWVLTDRHDRGELASPRFSLFILLVCYRRRYPTPSTQHLVLYSYLTNSKMYYR